MLRGFVQVNEAIMSHAADNAVFMHCLPRHKEEVDDEVRFYSSTLFFSWVPCRSTARFVASILFHVSPLREHRLECYCLFAGTPY